MIISIVTYIVKKSKVWYSSAEMLECGIPCENKYMLAMHDDDLARYINRIKYTFCDLAKNHRICKKSMSDKDILLLLEDSDNIKDAYSTITCIGPLSNRGYVCYYEYDLKQHGRIRRYIRNLITYDDQRWEKSDEDLSKQAIYPVNSIITTYDTRRWRIKYDAWHDRIVTCTTPIFSNLYMCENLNERDDYLVQIHFDDIVLCEDGNNNLLEPTIPEIISNNDMDYYSEFKNI